MKRLIAILISSVLLLTQATSCSLLTPAVTVPSYSLSDSDKSDADTLYDTVKDAKSISSDLNELVKRLQSDTSSYITAYQNAMDNEGYYDSTSFTEKMASAKTEAEDLSDRITKARKPVDRLRTPDDAGVAASAAAAVTYFDELEGGCQDLLLVLQFYLDQDAAAAPMNEFDFDSYGDDTLSAIDGLYGAVDQTILNFQGLTSCPEYMQATFSKYINRVSVYQKMLESMYYGISLSDPLRLYSAEQLFDRETIEISDCEVELMRLIGLQFDEVELHLSGRISDIGSELTANLKSITRADGGDETPDIQYSYLDEKNTARITYNAVDTIYPNLYSSMDSVVNLTAVAEGGAINAIVTAEIPGFTQKYEQKITVTDQVTILPIKPVVLTSGLDLSSSRDAQLSFSVTDADTGERYVEETKTIQLMSVYDFSLTDDEFGEISRDNVLAWLTPESEGILELRRNAVSWLEEWSGGQVSSLIGYQDYGLFDDPSTNTYLQIVALQAAISNMGVRYNMGSFSLAEGENQRVLLPDDVLSSGSGICIETAILFASAIQSADMHAMILFLPGHAQVAVETGEGTGQYFLVETTLLPFAGADANEMGSLITEMDSDQWSSYLEDPWGDGSGGVYVVDCDLVKTLGIQSIGYSAQ